MTKRANRRDLLPRQPVAGGLGWEFIQQHIRSAGAQIAPRSLTVWVLINRRRCRRQPSVANHCRRAGLRPKCGTVSLIPEVFRGDKKALNRFPSGGSLGLRVMGQLKANVQLRFGRAGVQVRSLFSIFASRFMDRHWRCDSTCRSARLRHET